MFNFKEETEILLFYLPETSKFDLKKAWNILDDMLNLQRKRNWFSECNKFRLKRIPSPSCSKTD